MLLPKDKTRQRTTRSGGGSRPMRTIRPRQARTLFCGTATTRATSPSGVPQTPRRVKHRAGPRACNTNTRLPLTPDANRFHTCGLFLPRGRGDYRARTAPLNPRRRQTNRSILHKKKKTQVKKRRNSKRAWQFFRAWSNCYVTWRFSSIGATDCSVPSPLVP